MTTKIKERDRAKDQAATQFACVKALVEALRKAREEDDYDEADNAERRISEDALSIQTRGGWHSPGEENTDEEYEILLCTGGPACRIVGELDRGQPCSARIEFQDWFTPWQKWLDGPSDEEDILLDYARVFYFGD
jgi:hypothetical protein